MTSRGPRGKHALRSGGYLRCEETGGLEMFLQMCLQRPVMLGYKASVVGANYQGRMFFCEMYARDTSKLFHLLLEANSRPGAGFIIAVL